MYTHPSINPQIQGKPSSKCDATATVTVSAKQGVNANLITPKDNLRRATGSRPRPALVKMTTSAIFLKEGEQKMCKSVGSEYSLVYSVV